MRYVLRADASRAIGAGHVMRSSSVAEELIHRGKDVIFVGKISDLDWVEERINSMGFTHIYENSMEFSSEPDSDVLIIDSYEIDVSDGFISPEKWLHIVAIVDDLTPAYSCNLRIHPGLDPAWTGNSKTPILAGPKYIPFRSSLSHYLNVSSSERHTLRIAVVAGGSDPFKLVSEIARILSRIQVQFEVYLFARDNFDPQLDARFSYVELGNQLDVATRNVDLVITTASTSSLEFLARGLCVGVIRAIDNQQQNYTMLGELGVAAQLGFRNLENNWEFDEQKIYSLVSSTELRRDLIAKAKGLIDFSGASRIVDAITNL